MPKTLEKSASEAGVIEASRIAGIAQNYCRLGASDAQLARFFDVSPETLGGWLADSPEFAAAVRHGRKEADVEMVDSLHRLGMGFVETVEKVMICQGAPMVVTYRKQHRPDYKAGMTWLCNRMPEHWSWPGTRRRTVEAAADAVDFFALPLLVEADDVVAAVDAEDEVIAGSAPLCGAHAVSTRREEAPRSGALAAKTTLPGVALPHVALPPPPPQPVLADAA